MKFSVAPALVLFSLTAATLVIGRYLYFGSSKSVNVRMAVYRAHYSSQQAEKDGVQELSRLMQRFPNAQNVTVSWEWELPNYRQWGGISWDRSTQTYEELCMGEPCPLNGVWKGISQTDIEEAASKNQTMHDILKKKRLPR